MSLEMGFIPTFAIVALGGIGMAGFVIWLRSRDGETSQP